MRGSHRPATLMLIQAPSAAHRSGIYVTEPFELKRVWFSPYTLKEKRRNGSSTTASGVLLWLLFSRRDPDALFIGQLDIRLRLSNLGGLS